MKIELNLDTKEKQALFLLLFNHPAELEEYAEKMLGHLPEYAPSWQTLISTVQQQRGDVLMDLIDNVFTYDSWIEVHEEFLKKGNT